MNKSAFLKLIKQVSDISDQQTEELEKVAATFPYCQTAHLLLAKSAYDKGSMLSSQRLRKASSYATDRQLLKRIIYTSSVAEPVFDTQVATEEQAHSEASHVKPALDDNTAQAPVYEDYILGEIVDSDELDFTEETEEEQAIAANSTDQHKVTDELAAPKATLADNELPPISEEAENIDSEAENVDSELAMLLTINSLSSSFTDLLAERLEDAAEAVSETTPAEETDSSSTDTEAESHTNEDGSEEPVSLSLTEEEPQTEDTFEPAEAPVNYSFHEIDRILVADALGYWMASSRMGESLELKNDYTRPSASFHPELILEYSKTHELEKAVPAAQNDISCQLEIIDQFLKLNPRLKTMNNIKLKPEPQEDLSLKSTKIKKGMASENLASIFLKQGKVKKALKIYEQLILKNPEKKSYFAEQIEKLQTLS
ncbi:hypothetical protein ACSX1A_07425 [Pontibacter sp. MBLB2868]|uniref:hypothetical protein n=1 Tax=Pontibacter sp. MBLB2868 TaxID=3451555 RepID=UPI003F756299